MLLGLKLEIASMEAEEWQEIKQEDIANKLYES